MPVRSYVAGSFMLVLDGVKCGFVKSIDGGAVTAEVVTEPMQEKRPLEFLAHPAGRNDDEQEEQQARLGAEQRLQRILRDGAE